MLRKWVKEDTEIFNKYDPTVYYMQCQIQDFINAIGKDSDPLVTGDAGRKTVELFTAIYRSTRDNMPIKFPLKHEPGFNGRGGTI
jgi:predicted dehydrogenase